MGNGQVRVAVLDANANKGYSEMLTGPFVKLGVPTIFDCYPVDFERLVEFEPTIIVVGLGRKKKALDRPIEGEDDLMGYDTLAQLESYPALHTIPTVILGNSLRGKGRPDPDQLRSPPGAGRRCGPLRPQGPETGLRAEKSAKNLRVRLPGLQGPPHLHRTETDLFCPRCYTAVVLLGQSGEFMYSGPEEYKNRTGNVADLIPPKPQAPLKEP